LAKWLSKHKIWQSSTICLVLYLFYPPGFARWSDSMLSVLCLYEQLKNYYTTFFGMAQAMAAWMLYFVATDAYRSVARMSSERTAVMRKKLRKIPRDIAYIVLIIAAFYSTYLPPLRVLMYRVDNSSFHLCNVPFENHWDFKIPEVIRIVALLSPFYSSRATFC